MLGVCQRAKNRESASERAEKHGTGRGREDREASKVSLPPREGAKARDRTKEEDANACVVLVNKDRPKTTKTRRIVEGKRNEVREAGKRGSSIDRKSVV